MFDEMKQLLLFAFLISLPQLICAQSFAPVVSYYAGNTPFGLAPGDLDNDGYPDVVTALYNDNSVGVLLNKKNGTFAAPVLYPVNSTTGYNSINISVGDVNGDGYRDIVALDPRLRQASVLLNNQNGTFASYVTYATATTANSPINNALLDVNGDGYPDIITCNSTTSTTALRTVSVLLNNMNGTFAAPVLYSTGSTDGSGGLAVRDINNDGYPDIATTYQNTSRAVVLLNNGNGTFAAASTYAAGITSPADIRISDVNRDGYGDLVLTGGTSLSVLLNTTTGSFAPAVTYAVGTTTSENLTALAVSDVNGDAYPDVLVGIYGAVGTAKVGVLLNNKSGAFATAVRLSGSYTVDFVNTADVNLDGKPDILVLSLGTFNLDVRLNQTVFLATLPALAQGRADVFPNPAVNSSNLSASELPANIRQLDAVLTTATGQVVQHLNLPVAQGSARVALPVAGLAPGLYLLRLTARDAQGTAVATLPVQRVSIQ
jgi:hypothetical protein